MVPAKAARQRPRLGGCRYTLKALHSGLAKYTRLDVVPGHPLAERLKEGPLPLSSALLCAADVAQALRDVHLAGRNHGQVNAAHVLMTAEGSELRSPDGPSESGDRHRDIMALGALIFEILTGVRPALGAPAPPVARVTGPRSSSAAIRASALRVAVRCLSGRAEAPPDMAKTTAEIRVLAVLAKQAELAAKRCPADAGEALYLGGGMGWAEAAVPVQKIPLALIEPAVPVGFLKAEQPSLDPGPPADPDLPEYRRCPGCHSADVHASKPRTRGEKLGAMALKIPLYRCHQCYHRWFLLYHAAIPCKVQKVQRRSF
jgi:hypothetical protein